MTLWKCTGVVQRSATGEILLMMFDEIPAKDQDASLISVQISLKNISHLRFNGMTEIRIQGAKHQVCQFICYGALDVCLNMPM